MKASVSFSCFLFLLLVAASEARARSNGVYIVYTGAAVSSSAGSTDSSHILSSASMKRWEDRVIHRYSNGFSGFAAQLSEEEAKLIAQRPEVVSVFPDTALQLHTTRSWDFLKEISGTVVPKPQLNPESKSSSSLSDQDVIIAILDTGIWPEAKSFNDIGMSPVPKKWKGKCIIGPDFKPSSCNRKLIGARNYITSDNSTSARDYNGHGTHVAAIAAGRPVTGASYNGIARGTARGGSPGARIAVYRVCTDDEGCEASAVLKAFDDAIADGVDVISVSFGSFFANEFGPVSVGAFHAVENGIVVVCSAGDGGRDPDPPSIMNATPWILTVGAATIDRFFESDIILGGNKVIKGGGVHSAKLGKNPVHPLIDGLSAKNPAFPDDEARNCIESALDAEKIKGKVVLCDTSDEDILTKTKLETIKRLGGIGVIFIDYYKQLIDSVYGSSPLVGVTLSDAAKIQAYINKTRNPVATILPTVAAADHKPAPAAAYFTGHGRILDDTLYIIKPDIVAPGADILSAWPSNVTDEAFNILSGTSMACPHVSGIAAMLKFLYPSWTPSAIKSAIMTTASQTNNLKAPITNYDGYPASALEIGAGEVTMLGPLQPGLVYETEIIDYLHYLCYVGYSASKIRLISSSISKDFSCPANSDKELILNMNYPSISIAGLLGGKIKKVTRTVMNIEEEESVYAVSFESDNKELQVLVNPSKLHFTKENRRLSYHATFTAKGPIGIAYGSITWSNGKRRVRIPFVVS